MRTIRILAGTIIAAALAAPAVASAQGWPSRPVEWIVPFAPGGSTDMVARIVADKLGAILKQPVFVVNRPGAESEIGYKAAARANPDGYTMVLTVPSVVTNPLYFKESLDPSELSPVIYLAQGPYILLGSAKTAPKTVPELIAAMKAHPGKISCAMTGGVGSIGCEMLQAMTNSALLKVPYRGSNPGTLAVMSGQVDLVFSFSIAARSAAQSDQIRALATTAPKRGSAPMPELPAIAEFIPGFELEGWDGVMVPRGTPRDVIDRLNKAMNAALNLPDVRAKLQKGGLDTIGGTPDEFALRLRTVQQTFKRVLDAAGVKPQ
ncbi:MAG: tripartite tricarboxylate transporter substrate binding protein [Xanthobacteraceae bacterium]|jgi:tripartite-type tricarboxylate transporter receptor subunit TctC